MRFISFDVNDKEVNTLNRQDDIEDFNQMWYFNGMNS